VVLNAEPSQLGASQSGMKRPRVELPPTSISVFPRLEESVPVKGGARFVVITPERVNERLQLALSPTHHHGIVVPRQLSLHFSLGVLVHGASAHVDDLRLDSDSNGTLRRGTAVVGAGTK